MSGFYISKVVVTGKDKVAAAVELSSGSNVICGYSDTGKSFVFDCINFAFGSQDDLEVPPEGDGYTTVFVELAAFGTEKRNWTLRRDFDSKDAWLYTCAIADIDDKSEIEVLLTAHKDGKKSVSTFLLQQSGFPLNPYLTKNAEHETASFTFRVLWNFVAVDEITILARDSPVLNKNVFNRTLNRSAFTYLLTGNGLVEKNKKISAAKQNDNAHLAGQLHLCEQLIGQLSNDVSDLESQRDGYGIKGDAIAEVDALNERIEKSGKVINDRLSRRHQLINELENTQIRLKSIEQMKARFRLLSEHYNSDLQRLDFLSEGQFLLSQLQDSMCPACGRAVDETEHGHENLKSEELVQLACKSEMEKIARNLNELNDTFRGLEENAADLQKTVTVLKTSITEEERSLQNTLAVEWNSDKARLTALMSYQRVMDELASALTRLSALKITQAELRAKNTQDSSSNLPERAEADQNDEASATETAFNAQIKKLEEQIQNILRSWDFSTESVRIDLKDLELEVGAKSRRRFGAGKRGILYAAWILALMEVILSSKNAHRYPRFVVIDSPLTNHKGRKKLKQADLKNDEVVPEEVKDAFFEYLTLVPNDRQVIVIENDVPSSKRRAKLNVIEFSDDIHALRAGFFTVEVV